MHNTASVENFIDQIYNSPRSRKFAILFVLAGIFICFIPLLPFVQNLLFSFLDTHLVRRDTGSLIDKRLPSFLSLLFFGLILFLFALCCLFSKAISVFLENSKYQKIITAVLIITGLLFLCFVSIFSYQNGRQWLNSDDASEMILGKLLAEENVFVSRNWHYSTEIRIIYQTIFTMPLFKLLDNVNNWALIRSLNILLNNIVLIVSYIYMAKQLKIQIKWIFLSAIFLVLPLSLQYWYAVVFGGFYAFFIAQLFCCVGLFIQLSNYEGTFKSALPAVMLFALLSFALGIQGIRSIMSVYFPLMIACICIYLKDAQKKKFPLFLGIFGFFICCIGFAFNYLLLFWFSFHSFDKMQLADLNTELFSKLGQSLLAMAAFFGFSSGHSFLSAWGLFGIVAIIGAFLLFLVVCRQKQFISVFFTVSVIFNIFVFIIASEPVTSRYFIPFMVFYIPLLAILFNHTEKIKSCLKRTAIVAGVILFIFGQSYLNLQTIAKSDVNSIRKGYIQYLLNNDLLFGFSLFRNANVTTELTDGKIVMVGLEPNSLDPDFNIPFKIHNWLLPKKYHNPAYYQGETFLLLSRTEWEWACAANRPFTNNIPAYMDNDYIVIRNISSEYVYQLFDE